MSGAFLLAYSPICLATESIASLYLRVVQNRCTGSVENFFGINLEIVKFFPDHLFIYMQEEKSMKKEKIQPSILLRRSEGYFTITELADSLGVMPSTVWSWADQGSILKPSHRWKHHNRRYYNRGEFEQILKFLKGERNV